MPKGSSSDKHAVPTEPVTLGDFTFTTQHGRHSPRSIQQNYRYDVLLPEKGRIPADLDYDLGADDLARVDNSYHARRPQQEVLVGKFGFAPGDFFASTFLRPTRVPLQRAEFVSTNGVTWGTIVGVKPFRQLAVFSEAFRAYAPRERVATSWLRQIAGPTCQCGPT